MNKIIIACAIFSLSGSLFAEEIIVNTNTDNSGDNTTPAYSTQRVPSAPGTVTTEIQPNPYAAPAQVPANSASPGIATGAIAAPSGSIAAPSRSIQAPTPRPQRAPAEQRRQSSENKNSGSLYESIRSGWNSFIDVLAPPGK